MAPIFFAPCTPPATEVPCALAAMSGAALSHPLPPLAGRLAGPSQRTQRAPPQRRPASRRAGLQPTLCTLPSTWWHAAGGRHHEVHGTATRLVQQRTVRSLLPGQEPAGWLAPKEEPLLSAAARGAHPGPGTRLKLLAAFFPPVAPPPCGSRHARTHESGATSPLRSCSVGAGVHHTPRVLRHPGSREKGPRARDLACAHTGNARHFCPSVPYPSVEPLAARTGGDGSSDVSDVCCVRRCPASPTHACCCCCTCLGVGGKSSGAGGAALWCLLLVRRRNAHPAQLGCRREVRGHALMSGGVWMNTAQQPWARRPTIGSSYCLHRSKSRVPSLIDIGVAARQRRSNVYCISVDQSGDKRSPSALLCPVLWRTYPALMLAHGELLQG
jgi:hypothetical protein